MKTKKLNILAVIVSCILLSCGAQHKDEVYTSDITHFWEAYDSIQELDNLEEMVKKMQRLYIDKGTEGLKAFMKLRNFDAEKLVQSINDHPKFWQSIRPSTFWVKDKEKEIDTYIKRFKSLYPDYREAKIYFTITAIRSGGTTKDSLVLIGTEIATGNSRTDVTEFPDKRLETFFKTQKEDNIVPFTIHEYVHTQQLTEGSTLLGQSIYEGACDFVTELVLERPLEHTYILYGKDNEETLKLKFRNELFAEDYSGWIYNGSTTETVGDLGYFMGYAICWPYYNNSMDKNKALKEIVELDYADSTATAQFLRDSGYYE